MIFFFGAECRLHKFFLLFRQYFIQIISIPMDISDLIVKLGIHTRTTQCNQRDTNILVPKMIRCTFYVIKFIYLLMYLLCFRSYFDANSSSLILSKSNIVVLSFFIDGAIDFFLNIATYQSRNC